jgi:hypothetical protein
MTRPDRFEIFTIAGLVVGCVVIAAALAVSWVNESKMDALAAAELALASSCCASSFAGELAVGVKRHGLLDASGGEIPQAWAGFDIADGGSNSRGIRRADIRAA